MNSTLRHCQLIGFKPATAGFSLTPMWVQSPAAISLDSRNYEGNTVSPGGITKNWLLIPKEVKNPGDWKDPGFLFCSQAFSKKFENKTKSPWQKDKSLYNVRAS